VTWIVDDVMSKEMKKMNLLCINWRIAMPEPLRRQLDRDAQLSGDDGEDVAPE